MRLSKEELTKKIKDAGCKYSLSWSKLNTFVSDPYSFYLKYLKNVPEERKNAYAFLGDIVHNGLEKFYTTEGYTREKMIDDFLLGIDSQRASDVKFMKDEDKNENIAKKYEDCIMHFLHNYEKASSKSKLEQFVGLPFGEYYIQGYIDHIYPLSIKELKQDATDDLEDPNNYIYKQYVIIEDFKTSTAYSGKKIDENAGQLKLYAIMLSNNFKIPISSIKIGWNFLKYVKVDFTQINGKVKTSIIERHLLDEELQNRVSKWAKKLKYTDEDINNFFNIMKQNCKEYKDFNILDGLPEEIKNKFVIRDCFVEIPLNEAIAEDFKKYVSEQVENMSNKIATYKLTEDDKIFWKEVTKADEFFFWNLCSYTAKNHKPFKEYLDKQNQFQIPTNFNSNNDDADDDLLSQLFSGLE